MKPQAKKTPIRSSLKRASSLHSKVKDGIGALEKKHRKSLAVDIRGSFADSLDLDKAMEKGHEQENRWDYLLGHLSSAEIIAIESHSARQDQITKVIKKKEAAKEQLKGHLKQGARIIAWLWVASDKVHFANTENANLRLAQNGIKWVGKIVNEKDLPAKMATKIGR